MDSQLWRWDAGALAAAIRARRVSSREATASVLARLEAVNPALNAVTVVLADQALAAADRADEAVRRGEALGALHGVPVTIKENVDQAETATTNGIVAFKDLIATSDSPQVASWRRSGAVIVGRTNTPGFSVRWHTDNALRGRTFNPWARDRTPGGSSGGAGAALAAGIAPLAHGNDLGGSIRYPAYCCGVAGIRPTLGRVPAYNATAPEERPPAVQLMSVQGPMARRVADVRVGLAAMATPDPRDPWWVPAPLEGPPVARPIRVALTVDPAAQGVHPDVADAVGRAGRALADAGYAVEEVEPPDVAGVARCWAALVVNEMRHVMRPYIQKYGDEDLKRAVDLTLAAVPDVGLDGYLKALAGRAKHLREWTLFLERYPLVVGPVSTEPPFTVGFDVASAEETARVLRAQRLLVAVNGLGLPAAAVPTGLAAGVPLGVQVIGARYREDLCLDAAEVIEARQPLPTPIDPVG
ncbi:MAG: amidase [Candidatus Rokubacteria bacterium RIFCSPLOWO2_12_FULL_71_22]|nr:MAG: amidase [Candidatus Rokubacteria bacterium RIFCSPLOWO2_02_FULL_72_37]OGL20131.1 MAG: amidase [Candidatus Rokubacteria bacterium RIFCSPLOWO2_12_FULL_71_22]